MQYQETNRKRRSDTILNTNSDWNGGLSSVKLNQYANTINGTFESTNEFNQEIEDCYKMYVRDLNIAKSTIIDKGFDEILIENNAYEKKIIEGINFTIIDINKAYNLMLNELKHSKNLIYPEKIKK